MVDEQNTKKLTGEELRMVVLLQLMWGALRGSGAKTLEKRLRDTPSGWKMFRQAFGLLSRSFDQLEDTIPLRQLHQINSTIHNGEVAVKLKRAGKYDDDMNVVRADALALAVGYAMRGECALCVKDRADIKRCPLRKAIDELCPPNTYETMGCIYRDLAHEQEYPDTEPGKI